jgi:5-methylcytosine-specific restriction endonuclease McrA
MPDMPPSFRPRGPSRRAQNQAYDRRRRVSRVTRRLYSLARWLRIRDDQLARDPFCRMCRDEGVATTATVCDHVEPHDDDEAKFWAGPFQSLCETHHNREKQRDEAARRRGG